MSNKLFKIICLIIFSIPVIAIRSHAQNWISYSRASGLSSNSISAIVEDDHSKIWVGTSAGLNRFDGSKWITYSRANGDSLIHDEITHILKDTEGNLWIGTEGGFSKIDPGADLDNPANWKNYHRDNTNGGLIENHIKAMIEDAVGNIWFATRDSGIAIVNPAPITNEDPLLDRNNWTHMNSGSQLPTLDIFALEKDVSGKIWVGTFAGVSRYNPQEHDLNGRWDVLPEFGDVRAIYADGAGYVWFGRSASGVLRAPAWNPRDREEIIFIRNASAFAADADGKIWIATLGRPDGIYVVDPAGDITDFNRAMKITQQDGLADNRINFIKKDSQGDLWIGTAQKGISKFDFSWLNFAGKFALDSRSVVAIAEDDARNIWLGTANDGIRIVNIESNVLLPKTWTPLRKREKALASDFVNAIFEDETHHLWIGTSVETPGQYEGLNLVDPSSDLSVPGNWLTFTVENTDSGLADNTVNTIAQDPAGFMWFGTDNGLSRVPRNSVTVASSWAHFDTSDGLNSNRMQSIFIDGQQILWLGTAAGLNRMIELADNLTRDWQNIALFDGKSVETIFEDADGRLWFGTGKDGVFAIPSSSDPHEHANWKTFTTGNGLASNRVQAIAQVQPDELWFATSGGLTRLRVAQTEGHIDSLWTIFKAEDGPEDINIMAAFKDSKDDLWFGSVGNGVSRHRIKKSRPETFIQSKLEATSIDPVVIEFEGADLDTPPHLLKYSHKIDDGEWTDFQPSNLVTIYGLSPGRHIFKVRAVDLNGNVDLTPARDVFYKISPRFGGAVEIQTDSGRVRLYLPPVKSLQGKTAVITEVKNYELENSSAVIVAYDITIEPPGDFKLDNKTANLAISFPRRKANSNNQLTIDRWESGEWLPLGGTVEFGADSVKITTAIKQFGRYAVRKGAVENAIGIGLEMDIQPRIFSPAGAGRDFGARTHISFALQNASPVTVKIYNSAGRLKKIIMESISMQAGNNVVLWDGRDGDGNFCVSGLYIVTIEAEGRVQQKTVVICTGAKRRVK